MGRQVDFDSIPDSTLLPENIYPLSVDSIEEQTSAGGKLMYTATFRVAEGDFTGALLYERFVVGSDDDPAADDPQTWVKAVGARRLKRLFKACQVPLTHDVDENIRVCVGQKFVATVSQETDTGEKDPRYKGVIRNRIAAMYALGERETLPHRPAPAAPTTAPPAAPKAAAPKAQSAPKVATVKCGYCAQMVPRTEYMSHVEGQHADQE